MLIIFMALILLQLTYFMLALVNIVGMNLAGHPPLDEKFSEEEVEQEWHEAASNMKNVSKEEMSEHFSKWSEKYTEASMFWIDENGKLILEKNVEEALPQEWTSTFAVEFIKERYGGDPFTVIAFVGTNKEQGFIVTEMPRSAFNPPIVDIYDKYGSLLTIGVVVIIFLFIVVSFLFFRGIRKRLLQLQEAMELRDTDGLPIEVNIMKKDEIGQLENTFNQMVTELRDSKRREKEEEQLRRELIANLSHDLRTPLTKIRAQSDSLKQEDLSTDGKNALQAIDSSIYNTARLIDNLMSYTLLSASKYTFEPKKIDIIRFVRESLATWYPSFEEANFGIDVNLAPINDAKWVVDPLWFGRILDNLFQNVLRHAKSGNYISVKTKTTEHYDVIIISDRGAGMNHPSYEKGIGIGLSIVDMMVKEMNLEWDIDSNEKGTTIRIKRSR